MLSCILQNHQDTGTKEVKKAILIDASCDIEEVEKFLDGKKLVAIFVTHAHYDHVANLDNLVKKYKNNI